LRKKGDKYIACDGKSLKKQQVFGVFEIIYAKLVVKHLHKNTPRKHERYYCKKQETQKCPKQECPKCGKMLSKWSVYRHTKNGCPKPRRGENLATEE
jgi:hypothetical protein